MGVARWLVLGLLLFSPSLAAAPSSEDDALALTNPLLGPEYAQWLVGAIGAIATEAERAEYLALRSDAEAEAFIEEFWTRPDRAEIRAVYVERAEEADRRFTEAAYPGRRTDRGCLFILYGEPEETEYEQFRNVDDPPVELWRYPKKTGPGLDGERPRRVYRFVKTGDLTREFRKGGPNDPARIRERLPPGTRPVRRRPPG